MRVIKWLSYSARAAGVQPQHTLPCASNDSIRVKVLIALDAIFVAVISCFLDSE